MKIHAAVLSSFLLLAGCASQYASCAAVADGEPCPSAPSLTALVSSLGIAETYLRMNANDIERLTGLKRDGSLLTIEREPADGECRCCATIFFDSDDQLRELVIIRSVESQADAKALVRSIIQATHLPEATTEALGDDVSLYRWKIPASRGQLGLDVTLTPVSPRLVRVGLVFAPLVERVK